MPKFRVRKESVIFFVGFIGIIGIVVFYGNGYFQQRKLKSNISSLPDTFSVPDDAFISYEKLEEKRRADGSKVILIDIRPNEFFASEHIPRSTNVPFEIIDGLTVRDGFTFVIITSSGDEQGFGAVALQTLHEKNDKAPILILKGGFEGWKQFSGQTISFGDPESVVDQTKVTYITAEEFKKRLDAKQSYLIVDMRPKDVFAQGHMPNAINLPFDQLENLYEKIPTGINIVAFGNSELEDFQAGVRLFDLGFFSTSILKGGFVSWKDKGFEVQK